MIIADAVVSKRLFRNLEILERMGRDRSLNQENSVKLTELGEATEKALDLLTGTRRKRLRDGEWVEDDT